MPATDEHILATLRAEHHQFMADLMRANEDFPERAERLGLDVHYDHQSDELMCTIGKPVEAGTISIGNTVFFRYDLDTLKFVGFGVLGFRAHLGENEAIDRLSGRVLRSPADAARAARDLVTA